MCFTISFEKSTVWQLVHQIEEIEFNISCVISKLNLIVRLISTIIFDLGNVLLNFDHRLIRSRWSAAFQIDGNALFMEKAFNDIVSRFEIGMLDETSFLNELSTYFGLEMNEHSQFFRDSWNDIFWLNHDVVRMLPFLAQRFQLVLLSNTNSMHIDYARRQFPEVFKPIQLQVFSHEMGMRKPDTQIFIHTVERADVMADECLYFDDVAKNVEAASAVGIKSFQYISYGAVREVLEMFGIQYEGHTGW